MDLRSAILSAGRKPHKFHCRELGLDVWLRRMTGEEAEEFFAASSDAKRTPQPMRLIASCCLCDETGTRLFARPEDVKDVAFSALDSIAVEALRINGLTKKAASGIKKKAALTSGTGSPGDSVAPSPRSKRK